MTLYLIEKAIKPQFAWFPHPTRKLQTYDHRNKKRGIAVVIFIGIAESFGFDPTETADHLCIEPAEYQTKAKEFYKYWEEILDRKANNRLLVAKDEPDCVYLKVRLTLNAINSQSRGSTLHCTLAI